MWIVATKLTLITVTITSNNNSTASKGLSPNTNGLTSKNTNYNLPQKAPNKIRNTIHFLQWYDCAEPR